MSDTPDTDSFSERTCPTKFGQCDWAKATQDALDFSRSLERDRNALRTALAQVQSCANVLRAERDALQGRVEKLEKLATRYQFLRNDPPDNFSVRRFPGETERGCYLDGTNLDNAIDEAISAQNL